MRNEALLFALKQQRDACTALTVTGGASVAHDKFHSSDAVPSGSSDSTGARSTADVGVQMVHSRVFALDAIIQCRIAEDERNQSFSVCSICGGTVEEALDGELTLALGLADQKASERDIPPVTLGKGCNSTQQQQDDYESAHMQLQEMRLELQQLHESLKESISKIVVMNGRHAHEGQSTASLLIDAGAVNADVNYGVMTTGAPDDSGVSSLTCCTVEAIAH
jgi:hypothetical protein